MKTLVIGAAIIDIIMKIKRLPKSGEDILCSETVSAVGGCAYNVAGTLRGFDADHDLFVPVGRGMYGNMIAGDLEKLGYPIPVSYTHLISLSHPNNPEDFLHCCP